MRIAATAAGLFVVFAGVTVFAQQTSLRREAGSGQQQPNQMQVQRQDVDPPLSEKRDWLRTQMVSEFSDVDRSAEIAAKVAQMSPDRVDALVKIYQKREAQDDQENSNEARRDQAISQANRDARVQQYQNRLAAGRAGGGMGGYGTVGYAPVITWLPEGTSLGASAVVSPDRRYVRMSLQPFFSHIPRVDTFNFYTGETQTYYSQQHSRPQQYSRPQDYWHQPNGYHGTGYSGQQNRQRPPRTYHDGIRTRTVH